MSRTDRVWNHVDEAFKSADKAFAEAEHLFNELPKDVPHPKFDTAHQLHFTARSFNERWRLAKKFCAMSGAMLFTGKTQLRFKDR